LQNGNILYWNNLQEQSCRLYMHLPSMIAVNKINRLPGIMF